MLVYVPSCIDDTPGVHSYIYSSTRHLYMWLNVCMALSRIALQWSKLLTVFAAPFSYQPLHFMSSWYSKSAQHVCMYTLHCYVISYNYIMIDVVFTISRKYMYSNFWKTGFPCVVMTPVPAPYWVLLWYNILHHPESGWWMFTSGCLPSSVSSGINIHTGALRWQDSVVSKVACLLVYAYTWRPVNILCMEHSSSKAWTSEVTLVVFMCLCKYASCLSTIYILHTVIGQGSC